MTEYVTAYGVCQDGGQQATGGESRERDRSPGFPADAGKGEPLGETSPAGRVLVTSPISQQSGETTFELYPRSLRVRRPFRGQAPTPPDRSKSQLQGFSDKSRGRLRFTAANAQHLQSQFCCTYHDIWPIDGREFKRHLNVFLVAARREFPFLEYLWVAEFQTRGAPHAHVYLNIPVNDENRAALARLWCRVVDSKGADPQLWAFHLHSKNFVPWRMMNGGYLCKYLDKEHQKAIPAGFRSFGRWWGNSRGLIPDPDILTAADLEADLPQVDQETGEMHDSNPVVFLVRTVGRYHEKVNRRSWFRRTNKTTLALTGAPVFRQALAYLYRQRGIAAAESPF